MAEGESLEKILARGALSEADVCRIGRDIADALAQLHANGAVHADIRPEKIVVSGGRVTLLHSGVPAAPYVSPEQALGKLLDARSDVFSLGIVLYEMATARRPFETTDSIIRDEAPDPSAINSMLSPVLTTIIARCLRKPREQRFESAASLSAALGNLLAKMTTGSPTPVSAPRVAAPAGKKQSLAWIGWLIAVLIIIVGLTIAVGARLRGRRTRPERRLQTIEVRISPPDVRPHRVRAAVDRHSFTD